MKVLSSWDDGSRQDVRVAQLLQEYEMAGIFYIPNVCHLSLRDIIHIHKLGFEIGGHTTTHPSDLKLLDIDTLNWELATNKKWLEELLGDVKVTSFCYPKGKHNEIIRQQVKESGFLEARTTLVGNVEHPVDMYRIMPTVHVYPFRKEYNEIHWLDYAISKFNEAQQINGYFHVWGHSWELDKFNLWGELEVLLKYIYDHSK